MEESFAGNEISNGMRVEGIRQRGNHPGFESRT